MNIFGSNVEMRLVIIIVIFYYLPGDFCAIMKEDKSPETRY